MTICMENLSYDFKKLNPREKRLAKEHLSVDDLCQSNEGLSYQVIRREGQGSNTPPEVYRIMYDVRSIIGINDSNFPIYDTHHEIEISLPKEYPVKSPKCKVISDIWHPNIKSEGQYKGRICSNTKEFGKLYNLDLLILRIGRILEYKNYHAINVTPYPEDEKVAKWVRDFAEPNKIVRKGIGLIEGKEDLLPTPSSPNIEEKAPVKITKIKIKPSSNNKKPNVIRPEDIDQKPNLKISIKRKK